MFQQALQHEERGWALAGVSGGFLELAADGFLSPARHAVREILHNAYAAGHRLPPPSLHEQSSSTLG